MKFANETEKLTDILTQFKKLKAERKRTVWGNYRIEGNSLMYCTGDTDTPRRIATITRLEEWMKEWNIERLSRRGTAMTLEEVKEYIKANDGIRDLSGHYSVKEEIARKVIDHGQTRLIGNTSILKYIGRTVAYGNTDYNRTETEIQKLMVKDPDFVMIPFSVFEQAELDLNKFVQIEKLKEETVTVQIEDERYNKKTGEYETHYKDEQRHFTGASLFSVDGKIYLFDIDRGEIKHKIFNPFLATIPVKVKTVKEAYEALKPKEVKLAEKRKLKVLRQGEWFFIPTRAPKIARLNEKQKLTILAGMADGWNAGEIASMIGMNKDKLEKESQKLRDGLPSEMNLQAGNSRPNTVSKCVKIADKTYCSGTVKHTGREHKDLKLKGWYLAVPNTSIENFTITGDVD